MSKCSKLINIKSDLNITDMCMCDRNHTCGRCTRRDAGISSLLETASENNMKTSLDKRFSVLYVAFNKARMIFVTIPCFM